MPWLRGAALRPWSIDGDEVGLAKALDSHDDEPISKEVVGIKEPRCVAGMLWHSRRSARDVLQPAGCIANASLMARERTTSLSKALYWLARDSLLFKKKTCYLSSICCGSGSSLACFFNTENSQFILVMFRTTKPGGLTCAVVRGTLCALCTESLWQHSTTHRVDGGEMRPVHDSSRPRASPQPSTRR